MTGTIPRPHRARMFGGGAAPGTPDAEEAVAAILAEDWEIDWPRHVEASKAGHGGNCTGEAYFVLVWHVSACHGSGAIGEDSRGGQGRGGGAIRRHDRIPARWEGPVMTTPETLRALSARIRAGEPETIELRTATEDALGAADHMVSPRFMLSDEDHAVDLVPSGVDVSMWGDYGVEPQYDHCRLGGDDFSLTRSAPGNLGIPRLITIACLDLRAGLVASQVNGGPYDALPR